MGMAAATAGRPQLRHFDALPSSQGLVRRVADEEEAGDGWRLGERPTKLQVKARFRTRGVP